MADGGDRNEPKPEQRKSWSPEKKKLDVDWRAELAECKKLIEDQCEEKKRSNPEEISADVLHVRILETKIDMLTGYLGRGLSEKYRYQAKYENARIELNNSESKAIRWREKFYKIKNPEVVRTEIESYDRLLPTPFPYDEALIEQKGNIHAKNEERRRQKFNHLLKESSHDFMCSLRKNLLIYWIEKPELLKLGMNMAAKVIRKKYHAILKSFENSDEFVCTVESKFYFICEHRDVDSELENAILNGPEKYKNLQWLINICERFACRVADLHRKISHKIHEAQFESDDEVPIVYNILKDDKYESCIQVLMSDLRQDDQTENS